MKKLIILLIPLLFLVGCEAKTEEFSKVCTSKTNSKDITDTEKTKVVYNNKDEVINVIITRTYKAKSSAGNIVIEGLKKSLENYNNNLAKSKAIKVYIAGDEKDSYVVKYNLDVLKMTKEELTEFDIRKNSIKYFNKFKNDGIECK